jgi:hypothetical protein
MPTNKDSQLITINNFFILFIKVQAVKVQAVKVQAVKVQAVKVQASILI